MTSAVCGFDTWFDNHYGLNTPPVVVTRDNIGEYYLNSLLTSLDEEGGNYYRIWKQTVSAMGVLYAVYIVEPGGYAVQLNGYRGGVESSLLSASDEARFGLVLAALDCGRRPRSYVLQASANARSIGTSRRYLDGAPYEIPAWNSTLCSQGLCDRRLAATAFAGLFGEA